MRKIENLHPGNEILANQRALLHPGNENLHLEMTEIYPQLET
jgi:hypothetical protein